MNHFECGSALQYKNAFRSKVFVLAGLTVVDKLREKRTLFKKAKVYAETSV